MTRFGLIAAAGIAAGLAGLATPASAQDIKRGVNGNWEVHFSGPCLVGYNQSGSRIFVDRSCSGSQVRTADMMMRGRFNNNQYNPGNNGWGWGAAQPQVRINNNGWGTVNFRNGCIVTFDRQGRRISDTRPCNSAMRAEAQRLYQQQAWGGGYPGGGYPGGGYGYGYARIDMFGVYIRAQMQGTNCTYLYTRSGNHVSSQGSQCNSSLRDRANDAVRDYRRQMGW